MKKVFKKAASLILAAAMVMTSIVLPPEKAEAATVSKESAQAVTVSKT